MPALPIVESRNVFEDISFPVLTGSVVPMVDEFMLECSEETLNTGVVTAAPLLRHVGDNAVSGVSSNWYLMAAYWLPRPEWRRSSASGSLFANAMVRACSANSTLSQCPIAQPIPSSLRKSSVYTQHTVRTRSCGTDAQVVQDAQKAVQQGRSERRGEAYASVR